MRTLLVLLALLAAAPATAQSFTDNPNFHGYAGVPNLREDMQLIAAIILNSTPSDNAWAVDQAAAACSFILAVDHPEMPMARWAAGGYDMTVPQMMTLQRCLKERGFSWAE